MQATLRSQIEGVMDRARDKERMDAASTYRQERADLVARNAKDMLRAIILDDERDAVEALPEGE